MSRLILFGVETELGQSIYSALKERAPGLEIAVPLRNYSTGVDIPPTQILIDSRLDARSQLESALAEADLVVNCDPRLRFPELPSGDLIDLTVKSNTEIIVDACTKRDPKIISTTVIEKPSIDGFLSYSLSGRDINFPVHSTIFGENVIPLNKEGKYKSYIEFDNMFFAYLFWFLAFFISFASYFVRKDKAYMSTCYQIRYSIKSKKSKMQYKSYLANEVMKLKIEYAVDIIQKKLGIF